MSQFNAWVERAAGLLPAIPARGDVLALPADAAIKAGLAAAAYRLKHGQSVWLSAPILSADILGSVICYCHQMRFEALSGQQRSHWLNRLQMLSCPDLLVWGRASGQYSRLKANPELGVQWVRANSRQGGKSTLLNHDGRILRTLLCPANGAITALCENLSQQTRPFLQIVDMTPFGVRLNPGELLDHLTAYFPGVPILVLTNPADQSTEADLRSCNPAVSHWRQQVEDATEWLVGKSMETTCRLLELPDTRLENPLVEALSQCRQLKEALVHTPQVQKDVLSPLYRVIRALRSLVLPLTFYEQHLDRHRRGGMFPVMPLAEWLDKAQRAYLPTGKAEQARDHVVSLLEGVLTQLNKGTSGKAQALQRWLDLRDESKDRALVITGSEREAILLRDWLFRERRDEQEGGAITVLGVSSVRDLYSSTTANYTHTLVVNPLWPNDYWALSWGRQVDWLAYPHELHWQQRVVRDVMAATAACDSAKMDWWSLRPVSPFAPPPIDAAVNIESWTQCSGEYPEYNSICCDIPEDPNWIADLMTPIEEPVPRNDGPPDVNEVSVTTAAGNCYRFHESQRCYILKGPQGGEKLEVIAAHELEVGDQLLQLTDEEGNCQSLFDTLLEYVESNSIQHKSYQRIAEQWLTYVDHAIYACGGVELFHQRLAQQSVSISIEQVKRWGRHLVIGPQRKTQVVPVVAKLADLSVSDADLNAVMQAMKKVRSLHIEIGHKLKQLSLVSRAGNTAVTGSMTGVLDESVLIDLVTLETVALVHKHTQALTHQRRQSVESVLRASVEASGGRLVATSAAYRSAKECNFKDLERIGSCFNLLSNEYYRVYGTQELSLDEAVEIGERYQVIFRGDTSAVTKGRHVEYRRTYQSKVVDIGKHLGIGNSRNPERCFRLHFHWDDGKRQLVIHHAGRHLSTSQG